MPPTAEPTPLADLWKEYTQALNVPQGQEEVLLVCKAAFYAGVGSIFDLTHRIAESGASREEHVAMMLRVKREVQEFAIEADKLTVQFLKRGDRR